MRANTKSNAGWICLILLISFCSSCTDSFVPDWPDPYVIKVTGIDYEWHVEYSGKDGIFDTTDDVMLKGGVNLPTQTHVKIELNSEDYLYFFEIPDLDLLGMAVPDQPFFLEMETPKKGKIEFKGNQMCGYTHQSLFGDLTLLSKKQFHKWLVSHQNQLAIEN